MQRLITEINFLMGREESLRDKEKMKGGGRPPFISASFLHCTFKKNEVAMTLDVLTRTSVVRPTPLSATFQ